MAQAASAVQTQQTLNRSDRILFCLCRREKEKQKRERIAPQRTMGRGKEKKEGGRDIYRVWPSPPESNGNKKFFFSIAHCPALNPQ